MICMVSRKSLQFLANRIIHDNAQCFLFTNPSSYYSNEISSFFLAVLSKTAYRYNSFGSNLTLSYTIKNTLVNITLFQEVAQSIGVSPKRLRAAFV